MAPDHAEDAAYPDDDTVVRQSVVPVRPVAPDLDDTIATSALPAWSPPPRSPDDATAPRPAAAVVPASAPPTEPPPPLAPRVRMPDGSSLEIDLGTVYVGRRPALPRVPASGVPRLVTVPSPGREVSSTHLALSAMRGAVVVRDMLSTNGTVVKAPGAPARTLLRGESAVLTPGTTLDLGDGNVIEVLP
ncbi:FHA domain-containing protein [Pseudolysinimonas sp.]|uniref:FHA domain-containing protein n=1 Tax=Pseudolysinimonas sp. TaxID=2680009 RepID=UPI003F7FA554